MAQIRLCSTLTSVLLSLFATAQGLEINGTLYSVDTLVCLHDIGPGVEYARYRLPERPLDIFVLETNLGNPYVRFEVWNGGDRAIAGECPSHRYAAEDSPGHDMVAAHNGDFYTVAQGRVGMSRMGIIGNGEIIFNPTGKPLFVLDSQKQPYISNVNFHGTLCSGDKSLRLHTVNQLALEWEPETAVNQLSLFTPAFGDTLFRDTSGGVVATIKPKSGKSGFSPNIPAVYDVVQVLDTPPGHKIPADGAVLYGKGESAEFIRSLTEGSEVTITLGVWLDSFPGISDISEAVGGSGHILMENGQVCPIADPALHPRTFMGINREGNKLFHVVVDGRSELSAGITLQDCGRLLQWLGAYHGINLDGGGSSCMVVNGDIVNRTSDGHERAVGNGAIIYSTAPADDEITRISFGPLPNRINKSQTIIPRIYGYNLYGVLKTRNLKDAIITADHKLGQIDANGNLILAPDPVSGYIYASYNGNHTRHRIEIKP